MQDFILSETKKALGRLEKTLRFIVKALFIAVLNFCLWFIPVILMGYFSVKSLAGIMEVIFNEEPRAAQSGPPPFAGEDREKPIMDFQDLKRIGETVMREWRRARRF